jgi:hypothetical protein
LRTLLHELESSDDSELSDDAPGTSAAFVDAPAWLKDFNIYLNTTDEIPEGQTIVQWWGVSSH